MSKWQPIETAPRDGSAFLACLTGAIPCVVCWHEKHEMFGEPDPWPEAYEEWVDACQRWGLTHWMPLPEPPA